jgi:hypothetical protein
MKGWQMYSKIQAMKERGFSIRQVSREEFIISLVPISLHSVFPVTVNIRKMLPAHFSLPETVRVIDMIPPKLANIYAICAIELISLEVACPVYNVDLVCVRPYRLISIVCCA